MSKMLSSPEYWRRRELANIEKDYISDEKLNKRLKSIYHNQLTEIQKEIDSFYQRYADKEGISYSAAVKKVSKHDVQAFQSTAKRMVEKKDFSELANKQLRLYNATMRINRLEMLKSRIGLNLLELSDDVSKEMRQEAFDRILETYERQAGILGDSVKIDTHKKAEQIVKGSFDGADFSERIWGKVETRIIGNTNVLYAEISKLLEQYLINGKGSIKLAPALKERFNTSTYEAERLARTEIRRMQTSAQVDFMQENGVTQYKFIAEPTACHVCRPLDNKVVNLDKMMVGTNASPMHPNCRCSITPYIDRAELEAKRLLSEAKAEEPKITSDLQRIEKELGTVLVGLEHRLKTEDSLKRKVQAEPGREIRDVLRYTYTSDPELLTVDFQNAVANLEKSGYTVSTVKNYWQHPDNPYNGVNTFAKAPSGYDFEIQYHTKESYDLKEGEQHKLYERARQLNKNSNEYLDLQDKMFELSESLKVPDNISQIKEVK